MAFDLKQSMYNPTVQPGVNIADGLWKLANVNMQKKQLAEQARQADMKEAGVQGRSEVAEARMTKQGNDLNKRFNLTLKDKQRAEGVKYEREDQSKVQQATMDFGKLVAAGDYRNALAMTPALKTLGVEVKTTANEDGTFNFDVEAPSFGDKEGPVNQEQQPQASVQEPAQEAEQLDGRKPDEPVIDDMTPQAENGGNVPASQGQIDRLQATMGGAPEAQPELPSPVPGETQGTPQGQPVGQGSINTGMLEAVTQRQLSPILGGIIGSYPGRFQGRIGNLVDGYSQTGLPTEKVMELMRAPQAQATGLMKSELGAEAARQRASLSQSGAGFSEARQREATAYNNMAKQAKQLGVDEAVLQLDNIVSIRRGLVSDNPNLIAASAKQLMLMDEKRLTDADFAIGIRGLSSDSDEFKQRLGKIIHNLTPDQKKRLLGWADESAEKQKRRIRTASDHLVRQADGYRYESGRLGANRYLNSGIPQQYLDKDMSYWNPNASQGGAATPRTSGSSKSATVSKSTSGTSESAPKSAMEEAAEFF